MSEEKGTLELGEVHPSAYYARDYIKTVGLSKIMMIQESMASCAIEGNQLAEVCLETWRRLEAGDPVSDRYIMGLALFIMKMIELEEKR